MKYLIFFSLIVCTQQECLKNGSTYDVCSNCKNIKRCFFFGIELEQPCIVRSNKTPFCDKKTNKCVKKYTCPEVQVKIKCQYKGFFPHPINCRKFIYCEGKNRRPQIYKCPFKTTYNHYKQRCSLHTTCITFSSNNGLCLHKKNKIVTYPFDAGIYAICPQHDKQLELKTCEISTQVLNTKTLVCMFGFVCKFEGIFRKNNTHFHMCYKRGVRLKKVEFKCAQGTIFRENEAFCRAEKNITEYVDEINKEGEDGAKSEVNDTDYKESELVNGIQESKEARQEEGGSDDWPEEGEPNKNKFDEPEDWNDIDVDPVSKKEFDIFSDDRDNEEETDGVEGGALSESVEEYEEI